MTVRTKNAVVTQSVMISGCALMLLGMVDSTQMTCLIGQTLVFTGMSHSCWGDELEIDDPSRFKYTLLSILVSGLAAVFLLVQARDSRLSAGASLAAFFAAVMLHVVISKIAAHCWEKHRAS